MKLLSKLKVVLTAVCIFAFTLGCVACKNETVKLEAIEISNYKTEFLLGEEFSQGELTVKARYSDSTTKTVENYTVDSTAYNKDKLGAYTITVHYTEDEASVEKDYTVNVINSKVVTALVVRGQTKEFDNGSDFVFDGVVERTYADGRKEETTDYTIDSTAYDKNNAGEYEIVVKSGGIESTYTVEVLPTMEVRDFTVENVGTTELEYGRAYVFDGSVSITYMDDRTEEDSKNYTIDTSKYNAYKLGQQEVSLKIGEESYPISVNVVKAKTFKLLMIGNSYSDDTSYYVPMIAQSLGFTEIEVGVLYIGGCNIKTHYNNILSGSKSYEFRYYENGEWNTLVGNEKQAIEYGIKYKDWDFITLQQASGDSGKVDTYNREIRNLMQHVRSKATNPNVRFIWNMTWAYQSGYSNLSLYGNDQLKMYNAIVNAVQEKIETNENIDLVLPVGTAVQNARTSYVGDSLNRDGTHLTTDLGRYIAALTMFSSLTGYTVDEIEYVPSVVDSYLANVAKESVKNALASKYVITSSRYTSMEEAILSGKTKKVLSLQQGYYNSDTTGQGLNVPVKDTDFAMRYASTEIFTKETLPVGSVIIVKSGYKYRPEAWVNGAKSGTRPAEVKTEFVVITEAWWGNYTERAFNISNESGTAITLTEAQENFEIWVP